MLHHNMVAMYFFAVSKFYDFFNQYCSSSLKNPTVRGLMNTCTVEPPLSGLRRCRHLPVPNSSKFDRIHEYVFGNARRVRIRIVLKETAAYVLSARKWILVLQINESVVFLPSRKKWT